MAQTAAEIPRADFLKPAQGFLSAGGGLVGCRSAPLSTESPPNLRGQRRIRWKGGPPLGGNSQALRLEECIKGRPARGIFTSSWRGYYC